MLDKLNGIKRDKYCGLFRAEDNGNQVTITGWVQRRRPLGGLIFVTVRDRTGIVQLTFDESVDKELFEKAYTLRNEYVICATGTVRLRDLDAINKNMDSGEIEILASSLLILSTSETTPFEIQDNITTSEEIRLKYRYLDLRRPEMQKNLFLRHKAIRIARDFFYDNGFIEIETPMLIKATPEGARDYLVPSRLHEGKFYALPQSPQLYKQLLMLSGFDRYVQVARCFRDEDLRADRQPEFTQIDFEMSFVGVEDVLDINERFVKYLFKNTIDVDVSTPIQRIPYRESIERFGTDKPDIRFGFEICDISKCVANCNFTVFTNAIAGGGSVRAINIKGFADKFTRKSIDSLTEFVRGIRASGLAFYKSVNNEISSSFLKFMTDKEIEDIKASTNFEDGDILLIISDVKNNLVLSTLGSLRNEVAKTFNILDDSNYKFVIITEFPFLDFDEESNEFVAMHHPFTSPMPEDIDLIETNPGAVRAMAYDVVLNGIELGSGSIRISDPVLQEKMFSTIGLTKEQANEKFGFLLEAFKYGTPPHGGFAFGIDRLLMLMCGASSIRDVVAFPKVQNASEPMTSCPSVVASQQLADLNIAIVKN